MMYPITINTLYGLYQYTHSINKYFDASDGMVYSENTAFYNLHGSKPTKKGGKKH